MFPTRDAAEEQWWQGTVLTHSGWSHKTLELPSQVKFSDVPCDRPFVRVNTIQVSSPLDLVRQMEIGGEGLGRLLLDFGLSRIILA